ncbi:MAG: molybdenum cofactor biosynthesis protein B [Rhodothalassiaceae bacterium]
MPGIDESRAFAPIGIALLTVSDSRTPATDRSGDLLAERVQEAGHRLIRRAIAGDEIAAIRTFLLEAIADPAVDAVIATGGTGLTGRDVTPEAFEGLYDKAIPGFGELFRMLSYHKIGSSTIQSRATAGLAGGTLLFALPGSPGACRDAWDDILKYQLDIRFRPCNFVELMPRFSEK